MTFAIFSTGASVIMILVPTTLSVPTSTPSPPVSGGGISMSSTETTQPNSEGKSPYFFIVSLLESARTYLLGSASLSWILTAGLWIWRGRTRAAWLKLGFDRDTFKLFLEMKRGGLTRLMILKGLVAPKDRLQLSKELGIDWKAINRHVRLLEKYGLLGVRKDLGSERNAVMFELTSTGKKLLQFLEEQLQSSFEERIRD